MEEIVAALHKLAVELGLKPCVSRNAIGYSTPRRVMPYVMRVVPKRDPVRARFDVPRERVPSPPPWTSEFITRGGSKRTVARLDGPAKIDECRRLLRCELAERQKEQA